MNLHRFTDCNQPARILSMSQKRKTKQSKSNEQCPDNPPAAGWARWVGVLIFLSALLVRVGYLYDSRDNPTFTVPIVDSMTYDQMAQRAVQGQGLTRDFFWQPFFYPFFLSLVYRLTGSSILAVKIIQVVLGGGTCVLTYLLGKKVFGLKIGVGAGLITAVYGPLIFLEGELLAGGWAAFEAVLLVLIFLYACENRTWRLCFLVGLCGAVSIITRPTFLLFYLAGCVWLTIGLWRAEVGWRSLILRWMGILAGFLLIAIPVATLNHRVTGHFAVLPSSGGINLYIGNNPNYGQTLIARPGLAWKKITDLPEQNGFTGDSYDTQGFYYQQVKNYALDEPLAFACGLARKTVQFINSREIPRNVNIYLFTKWSGLLRVLTWKAGGFGFPFGILLPLAILGLINFWRRIPGPIVLFVFLYPLSIILVFVAGRYRIPVIPVMSVLAAAGVTVLIRFIRMRNRTALSVAGAVGIVIILLASLPGPFAEETPNYEAELYFGLADSLNKQQRHHEAITAYYQAIALRGDYVEAHHNLGRLLADAGRIQEAMEHYRTALKLEPQFSGVHNDLGRAFFELGQTAEAVKHYHQAIEIDPRNVNAYNNLGNALFQQNKRQEALEQFLKAVELDPHDGAIHNNIGNIYSIQGRHAQAIEHYETSLSIRPADAKTLSNLGNALLGMEKYQQATKRYRQSLEIEPGNAKTHFNLGISLEKQGQIDQAVLEYETALTLDPEYKAAYMALQRHKTQIENSRQ